MHPCLGTNSGTAVHQPGGGAENVETVSEVAQAALHDFWVHVIINLVLKLRFAGLV